MRSGLLRASNFVVQRLSDLEITHITLLMSPPPPPSLDTWLRQKHRSATTQNLGL